MRAHEFIVKNILNEVDFRRLRKTPVDNLPEIVFHATQTENYSKIKSRGLRLGSNLSIENKYENGIFFFSRLNEDSIMDVMGEIFAHKFKRSLKGTDRPFMLIPYVIFEVSTNNLDSSSFYKDETLVSGIGVWTDQAIPSSNIGKIVVNSDEDHRREVGLL